MPEAVNITQLDQYFKQRKTELLTLATVGLGEFLQHFNVQSGIKDEYEMTSLQFKKMLKPYQKAWNPLADKADLIPRTLKVRLGQVELEEEPNQYRTTPIAEMMTPGVKDDQHPFESQLMDGIIKQVAQDINLDLYMRGQRNGSGSNPGDINDGFLTIIESEIAAGNISVANGNLIQTGTIDDTNAVKKLKNMFRSVPKAYRGMPLKMYMSHGTYDNYVDDYQNTNNSLPYNQSFEKTYLEGSNRMCELVPLAGMGDSPRVIIAPRENMMIGTDLMSDAEDVTVWKPQPKVIGIYLSMAFGVQIGTLSAIWVNDQSTDDSSSAS